MLFRSVIKCTKNTHQVSLAYLPVYDLWM